MKTDIAILGAGITGLSLAHFLKKSGIDFLLLEKEKFVGGKIKSIEKDGYICECGPNTVQLQEEALYELIDDLNISDKIIFANKSLSRNRYVNTEKGIHKLPSGPLSLIGTSLFNFRNKWNILKDLFLKSSHSYEKITVEEYFKSKFGESLTNNIIDPFVTGIYAGDISKMSFKHAFPKLYKADKEKGSLIRGLMSSREKGVENKGIFSFKNGLSELPKYIESEVEDCLFLNSDIRKIEKSENGKYKINYLQNSKEKFVEAFRVIDTRSLRDVENSLGVDGLFPKMEYVPVISLHLGFNLDHLSKVPDGFGILNNKKAHKKYLGSIFNSDIFPHTAPKGHKLYTILIGGARNPEYAINFNDEKLNEVIDEFRSTVNIENPPNFVHYYSWPAAIPQYNIGHDRVYSAIDDFHKKQQNYFLLGNYKGGVSIGDCVKKSKKLANQLRGLD